MGDVSRLPGKPYRVDMARFLLHRHEDVTGISGTGVVAEGVRFSDGTVVIRWVTGDHRSTVIWPNIEAVIAIHGHGGTTTVEWIDP